MGEKPTDDEVAAALLASGFLLEQKVALVLEKCGYATWISSSYVDPDEGKPREIDVVGLKYIATAEEDDHPIAQLVVIECKSTPQTHVAFTRPWTPFERSYQPFEVSLKKAASAKKATPREQIESLASERAPGRPHVKPTAWKALNLVDDWEVFRLNKVEKAVQVVRIERENKGFKARNVLPEIGFPPIKAAYDLRKRFFGSDRDGVLFPACVTSGDLKIIEAEGVDEVRLLDRKFVAVMYDNRAEWMNGHVGRSVFDVVPFVHLEEWLTHIDEVVTRLNSRVRKS